MSQRAPAGRHRVTATGKRRDIQGLRMLAVVGVFVNHVSDHPKGAFVGVDVFFVISGFLITGLLVRDAGREGMTVGRFFGGFYERRARRILPAALVVLAASWVAAGLTFRGARVSEAHTDILYSLGFAANVHYARTHTDYFHATSAPSITQHFWSLAVEEQFYIVWPVLVLLIFAAVGRRVVGRRRQGSRLVLLGVISALTVVSFAYALHDSAHSPATAYFSTFARGWELGVGAVLALALAAFPRLTGLFGRARGPLMLAGVAAILLSFFVVDPGHGFPAPWAALPVLATAAVILLGPLDSAWTWPLSNRVNQYLGEISYSLYLWHWPTIVVLSALMPERTALYYGVVVAASLGLSVLSYEFVETPLRTRRAPARTARPASGRPASGRPASGRPASGRPASGRPASGRPASGRPASGRPASGRPASGRPASGRPASGRPASGRPASGRPAPARRLRARWVSAALAGLLVAGAVTGYELRPAPPAPSFVSGSDTRAAAHDATVAQPPKNLQTAILSALQATSFPSLDPGIDELTDARAQQDWQGCNTQTAVLSTCTFPSASYRAPAGKTAMLIGDSIALSYMPTVKKTLLPLGWKVVVVARQQCTAAYVSWSLHNSSAAASAGCDRFHAFLPQAVQQVKPDLVLLTSTDEILGNLRSGASGSAADAEYQAGMAHTHRIVDAPGRRVITLSPPPGGKPLSSCDTRGSTPAACVVSTQGTWGRQAAVDKAVARTTGTAYLDDSLLFCSQGGFCPSFVGTTPVLYDGRHLTSAYAESIAPLLSNALVG